MISRFINCLIVIILSISIFTVGYRIKNPVEVVEGVPIGIPSNTSGLLTYIDRINNKWYKLEIKNKEHFIMFFFSENDITYEKYDSVEIDYIVNSITCIDNVPVYVGVVNNIKIK